ncbi:hypothetical protein HHI36_007950 [Cryptolaemus montrouzieri]|uniref:Acyl-CoA oxidase n=1 Tax=Cryptolaemus montrouzieri TaxID=559131 RepID=A0ABD2MQZ3_9CUCU
MSLESLKDFKPGPLEFYRKKASFNWKKLKTVLDTPELVNYKDEIVEALEKFPEFERNFYTETLDEKRRICARQNHIVKTLPLLSTENLLPNMKKFALCNSLLTLISPDALIKYTASVQLFVNAIISLGTKRHRHFIEESNDGKIHGAFCLTEVGHGTNTKRLETTATYDVETKEFIIDSPTFTAAKCWSGGLGQTASVVVVMAQLIVNGERKGIHGFVAPIRDPKTLIPYPGVIVGDLGEKIGLNGVDNG